MKRPKRNPYTTPMRTPWLGRVAPAVGAMALVAALAAVAAWQRDRAMGDAPAEQPAPRTGRYTDVEPSRTPPPDFSRSPVAGAMALAQSGDRPYEAEPADLDPLPGSRRVIGLERDGADGIEWICVRLADGVDPRAALRHYITAATGAGFAMLPDTVSARRDTAQRMFVRGAGSDDDRPLDVLTVRATASDGGASVLIWLRRETSAE